MQPVLDAPMASNRSHQPSRAHFVRRQAGDQVAGLMADRDAGDAGLGIDPQDHPDAGEGGRLADVVDLLALDDPELADVDLAAFFLGWQNYLEKAQRPFSAPALATQLT
jgi:hypothetical protein